MNKIIQGDFIEDITMIFVGLIAIIILLNVLFESIIILGGILILLLLILLILLILRICQLPPNKLGVSLPGGIYEKTM